MAIKFESVAPKATNRKIEKLDICFRQTTDSSGTVSKIPHRLVVLADGTKGYITEERYPDMQKQFVADADGDATLPTNWLVGKTVRIGMDAGYFYDNNTLTNNKVIEASMIPDVV